jgi:AraC-like DNA-binding protein
MCLPSPMPRHRFFCISDNVVSSLTDLQNDGCTEAPVNLLSGAQRWCIQRAVALIEANFTSRLTRKEMARTAGMSESYFSYLFSRQFRLSPHQYLVRCRLQHARKLLLMRKKELSIVDVACDCGFADQAHFTRHFRRAYGVTPLGFVRAIRGISKSTNVQYGAR